METKELVQFNSQQWGEKLNEMLLSSIVQQCTNFKNYEDTKLNQGDVITLNDNLNIVIDQKKFFAFKINDLAQVQANADIMEAHLTNAKNAIEEVQDAYLLSQHANVDQNNIIGTEEAPVTLDKTTIYSQFVKLALALKNSDAVTGSKRPWVVINPTIESYLLQSTEFISACYIADETLRKGAIGRFAGMDVLVSINLTAVSDKYYVLAGTNDAITFVSQLAKIESLHDKDSFSDLVRGLYLYDAKTVQPKALAKLIISAN